MTGTLILTAAEPASTAPTSDAPPKTTRKDKERAETTPGPGKYTAAIQVAHAGVGTAVADASRHLPLISGGIAALLGKASRFTYRRT